MIKLNYINIMQIPNISKVTLNMGLGKAVNDKKIMEKAEKDLKMITGQKPIITKARKSIASFKLRIGFPIGIKVTLRRNRMWEFLDRLINIAIPRIRDFRGLNKKAFDGNGNYTIGLREQIIFPEIDYEKINGIRGLNITITTTAKSDKEGFELLSALNFKFKK
ncbi:50S ribosomal protein L5 [Candidatus Portiera aleyrodidarum]|uniref:Large ribosomal subunit protein uL5 n=1 Tax=Candidatus Portiera aleyrodidarum TV TaxID=1297582 RepID=A0A8D3XAL2_9GAMM|nr:50S ribosomal protein L5 [Candidatus Portiera aleyrodidarum]AGI27116.1 ribosomal protein L5 [Candidatus Portiera aleyrodidarum TV]CEI59085.1 50S ribosomal protein L5 [Candidatus Portiera aleyrodidarum]